MTFQRHYLDWNATAPLRPEARAAMVEALDLVGNPSSVHAEGRRARRIVEDAREKVARLVGAKPAEVVFTSGATEANNWVVGRTWDRVVFSRLEHPSVVAPALACRGDTVEIGATRYGSIDVGALAAWLENDHERLQRAPGRTLLALQAANNETGIVQPLAAAAALAAAHGVLVHSDAVQAVGRLPIDFARSNLSFLSISGHKLGAPKGIGALIVRSGAPLPPRIIGGGQERGMRAGTENVAAIAGFGAAAAAASGEIGYFASLGGLRDRLEDAVVQATPEAVVIGHGAERLANTACLALPGRMAETLVAAFDLTGIAVSAGAACSSGKVQASPVLAAMGLAPEITGGAIRISIGPATTVEDIDAFVTAWTRITRRAAQAA
ncbi:MAG: cysteine desulfurase family protein [Hyphomicrobiaceae bacterium]